MLYPEVAQLDAIGQEVYQIEYDRWTRFGYMSPESAHRRALDAALRATPAVEGEDQRPLCCSVHEEYERVFPWYGFSTRA